MSKLISLSLALVVTFSLLLSAVGPAVAANDTQEGATLLTAQNPSASDQLVGDQGGRYRYYRFDVAGGADVRIELRWQPGPSATGVAFGYKVYGAQGFVREGVRQSDVGDVGIATVTFVALTAGSYMVQVGNYASGLPVNFTLTVSGLAPGASPAQPAPASPAPSGHPAPAAPAAPTSPVGTLVGQRGGAVVTYPVMYPGGNFPMRISLTFGPSGGLPSDAFGFNVYYGDKLIGTGVEEERTSTTASKGYILSTQTPGQFVIQVYNYTDGVAGDYVLKVSGQGAPPIVASGNDSPNRAITLTPDRNGATGSLPGNAAGSFAFFNFQTQGKGDNIYIALAFKPGRGLVGNAIGFNVYRWSDTVATSIISDGLTTTDGVAYVTLSGAADGLYSIQVYNYAPGITADYTLYVAGIK